MAGFNHFPEIAAKFGPAVGQVVRKTAFDVQAIYASTAPRDTGFMVNSAYVVTSKESTYGQGVGTPPKDSYLLPEVARPSDDYTAHFAVGANYAVYPELGTRYQTAQPAFYPAMETGQAALEAAMSKFESLL